MYKSIEVYTESDFSRALEEAKKQYPIVFAYFKGAVESCPYMENLSTSEAKSAFSWCPDCVVSGKIIYPSLKALTADREDIAVLDCEVVREGYKGNPDHPYRPYLENGIPSLTLMTDNALPRIGCESCQEEDLVRDFIKKHI